MHHFAERSSPPAAGRLAVWSPLYAAAALNGVALAWVCANGGVLPWYAIVVIVWLLGMLMMIAGRRADRMDPPNADPPMPVTMAGPAPGREKWVIWRGLLVRPGSAPANHDERAAWVYGWMWVWLASFAGGTILFITLNV